MAGLEDEAVQWSLWQDSCRGAGGGRADPGSTMELSAGLMQWSGGGGTGAGGGCSRGRPASRSIASSRTWVIRRSVLFNVHLGGE